MKNFNPGILREMSVDCSPFMCPDFANTTIFSRRLSMVSDFGGNLLAKTIITY